MRLLVSGLLAVSAAAALFGVPAAPPSPLLPAEIEAAYIIYSYDHDHSLAANVLFRSPGLTVRALRLETDHDRNVALFSGEVELRMNKLELRLERLLIDLRQGLLLLENSGSDPPLRRIQLAEEASRKPDPAAPAGPRELLAAFKSRSYSKLRDSLIYFTMTRMVINRALTPRGYSCQLYLEGVPSVKFRRFKLSSGVEDLQGDRPLEIDAINFIPERGLLTRWILRPLRSGNSPFAATFEIETAAKPPLDKESFDFRSDLSFRARMSERVDFNIHSVFHLDKSWQNDFFFVIGGEKTAPRAGVVRNEIRIGYQDFNYVANENQRWFRYQQLLERGESRLSFEFQFGSREQKVLNLEFRKRFGKAFAFSLKNNYSQLLVNNSGSRYNKFNYQLSYQNRLLSIEQQLLWQRDYSLGQTLFNPSIAFRLQPLVFYSGLLKLSFQASFESPRFSSYSLESRIDNAFFTLKLSSERLQLSKSSALVFNVALEELLSSQESRSYLGVSYGLDLFQRVSDSFRLAVNFNYHSQRKNTMFFAAGTAAQTVSPKVEFSVRQRFSNETLLFYDIEQNRLRNFFTSNRLAIGKYWSLEGILNYDLLLERTFYEINLYRKSGRFQFRAGYRSISRQFYLELRPAK